MAKSKDRPAEFPSDWHFEAHMESLERELLGCQRRVSELEAVGEKGIAYDEAVSGVEAVRAQLAHYGAGQKASSTRPRSSGQKRKD